MSAVWKMPSCRQTHGIGSPMCTGRLKNQMHATGMPADTWWQGAEQMLPVLLIHASSALQILSVMFLCSPTHAVSWQMCMGPASRWRSCVHDAFMQANTRRQLADRYGSAISCGACVNCVHDAFMQADTRRQLADVYRRLGRVQIQRLDASIRPDTRCPSEHVQGVIQQGG